ncbi:hypothetical protein CI610_02909 [invertebrate metagenome]|uniref:Reverse transcriptase domain-containing protein n=1 Tax=invertebrate metagenome TaxID=1711999 RepID=A0A2H9T4M6_9ZZZZ
MYDKATAQINTEIENGNYIQVDQAALIVSPIAVIPKSDGGVRLIHDCSKPTGLAVNDYVSELDKQRFQSVDDAVKLVTPFCYMAKVDLKSAYRSVPISKHSQKVTGLKWEFKDGPRYLVDTKLPFGSKSAPGIFHRLSQSVRRMMRRKGFKIVAYLDDFFLCETTKSKCLTALNTLLGLLRKLGFMISWAKVIGPTQKLTFLGIEIDSATMSTRLPDAKLLALREELASFSSKLRASKKQLQSLAGKLNWAASVIYGGRCFLRRILNAICTLKHKAHKIRLVGEIRQDIDWWLQFMSTFNGKSFLLDKRPITDIHTDACVDGGGGCLGNDWFYANWQQDFPDIMPLHINEKEVFAVTLAVTRWAPLLRNRRILIHSDNMVTVNCINKGTSRNETIMHSLRTFFWLSAYYNFHITACHIPGKHNVTADTVSRLSESSFFWEWLAAIATPYRSVDLTAHMSSKAFHSLLSRHGTTTEQPR